MRIMQIGNSHYDYLKHFSKRFKNKTRHAELMQAYVEDYYWCCHTLTPALERMGHETFLCVPTETISQKLWCREHNVPWNEEAPALACLAQVEWFQPDILYVGSASIYHDALLEHLHYRPRLIAGWHATITRPHMFFRQYDLILSSHEECLLVAQHQGARRVDMAYPGIPAEFKDKFAKRKHSDVCFSGYWAESHPRRNQFLRELAERMPALPVDCAYHLGFYDGGPHCPDSVRRYDRGAVWGLSMFKAFAAARIVLNGYASINFGPQNLCPNMRQLEGMGVGSFMLTEASDNLDAFFTQGRDLETYASTDELVEKMLYYLRHEDAREEIAAQGLATCQKYYTLDIRARAFMDAVGRILDVRPGADSLERMLLAIVSASRHDSAVAAKDDVRQVLAHCLALVRERLLDNSPELVEQALPMLARLEELPVDGMKHVDLCRALRSVGQGDDVKAEALLRRELENWPENDAARNVLSALVLRKNGKSQPFAKEAE